MYDDPKFQEKYFTYGSAKKICTGKISCFLRDLQWRIKNSIKKQMHKSNNSRTVKGTEVYDGLKFQEKYFTYGSAKKNCTGKISCLLRDLQGRIKNSRPDSRVPRTLLIFWKEAFWSKIKFLLWSKNLLWIQIASSRSFQFRARALSPDGFSP